MDDAVTKFAPLALEEMSPRPVAGAIAQDEGELVSRVPPDAPPAPVLHPKLGEPSARWTYKDATGATLFYVMRFDPAGDRKQFAFVTAWHEASEALRWRWKGVPSPRPLYTRDRYRS
jgi:putative DNA primase/helicase